MNRSNDERADRSITRGVPGSDFLQLDIGEAPFGGRAAWLAERLRRAISEGRLPVGGRLPATRVLAAELDVSRGVVTEAYRRLSEDGHVTGRGRNGTVVVAAPVRPAPSPAPPRQASRGDLFTTEPGDDLLDLIRSAPARIDLSPGVPDLAAFPRAAWLRAEREALAGLSASGLGYGDPRGVPELRRAVAHWLARNRGIGAEPDEVIVVAGTAQALALVGQVLRADGVEEIAVEDPGSLGVRQQLGRQGLRTPPVPVDTEGVRVRELGGYGAVLLTPAHQFPTGVVLGGARRRALMDWAAAGGLIVEDDYDAEHRYDRPPVSALRSMLPERVYYAGSVSKLLAPALRTGWLLAPARHQDALVAAKRFADLGNAVLPQLVLARLMESGELERHLRLVRRRHRLRRDAMIAALRERIPGAVVHGAAAGLHLLITFPEPAGGAVRGDGATGFTDTGLAAACLARGVKVHPLSWHRQRPGPPGLLLGYAASPATAIAEGVAVIADALLDRPS
ncbi:PLP-dependent aminotransferase family protein [Streptomyces sp. NPDC002580]|uniref:MocR-like pyridoxine biosynthesis transcription factor PdxR n=1 Tax=Streptomyces sp. NPDC002580 TaxID=3364653 RepID=UPI0036AEC3B9